jgi:hypothetical protein
MYKGVVVEGINLAGDPFWGTFGSFATGAIVFFARSFAHSSVYQAYETADHKRIGFQMHTIFGKPGRKVEVEVGNVRFLQKNNQIVRSNEPGAAMPESGFVSKVTASSYVPIKVEGIVGNVIVDITADYYDKTRFIQLINDPQSVIQENVKENRSEFTKDTPSDQRRKRTKRK